ncbi:YhgE/Pip domain-containing protein [Streptomyces coffeae]|uniref:DUF3533 domain-containing protein n=1 Tax=Streptomyces coffeae TaxID=621382 RepID=A0ABS1NEM4_9ACTN|nr:DUF3533 domain-containing protein [Streptomyces coffeae]MBL1098541.1 DUF3533 domain-containing protein [Streptomyces coffeae]
MPSPRPSSVLRSPRLWTVSGLILAIATAAFSLLYVGGNLDPKGNLRDLPVALVNEDQSNGARMNLGDQIVSGIDKATAGNNTISWQRMNRQQADKQLGQGKVFGALVIPQNFTAAVTRLTSPEQSRPSRPTLTVLTNQAAGSVGSAMADRAAQQAAHTASTQLGTELLHHARAQGTHLAPAAELLLTDPVAVTVADGHPLGSHSGMGLSAFYYSLVLVVCGMLGANLVNSQVDTALGYLHSDIGPFRQRMPVQHTTRVRTLATSITLMAGLAIVMGSLVEAITVSVLGMDASHLTLLWLYSVSTIAVVGISGLALLAAFGTPGMLLLTIVFIAMAVPTSGATVPLQALPDFFRALAVFEPLRQITDGMRSILYFNAQADAGLTRAWLAMAIALGAALLFGLGVTRFYDRRGLHRIPPPTTPVGDTLTPATTR